MELHIQIKLLLTSRVLLFGPRVEKTPVGFSQNNRFEPSSDVPSKSLVDDLKRALMLSTTSSGYSNIFSLIVDCSHRYVYTTSNNLWHLDKHSAHWNSPNELWSFSNKSLIRGRVTGEDSQKINKEKEFVGLDAYWSIVLCRNHESEVTRRQSTQLQNKYFKNFFHLESTNVAFIVFCV